MSRAFPTIRMNLPTSGPPTDAQMLSRPHGSFSFNQKWGGSHTDMPYSVRMRNAHDWIPSTKAGKEGSSWVMDCCWTCPLNRDRDSRMEYNPILSPLDKNYLFLLVFILFVVVCWNLLSNFCSWKRVLRKSFWTRFTTTKSIRWRCSKPPRCRKLLSHYH